jgi:uncharacterized protein YjiS (DUF1127 family)
MGRTANGETESLNRAILRPLRTLERWLHERQTAAALGALDDATLRDIGVRRCDIPRLAREDYAKRTRRRQVEPSGADELAPISPPASGESRARASTSLGSAPGGGVAAMWLALGGVCAIRGHDAMSG